MPEKIAYVGSVTVLDGPRAAFNRALNVDAYDKFNFAVAAGTKVAINVGAGTSVVTLLVISSSQYSGEAPNTLTVQVDAKTAQTLDEPLIVAGGGVLSGFGKFDKLTFENKLAAEVTIEVFIARDPIP
jgi:hypothetical protein